MDHLAGGKVLDNLPISRNGHRKENKDLHLEIGISFNVFNLYVAC